MKLYKFKTIRSEEITSKICSIVGIEHDSDKYHKIDEFLSDYSIIERGDKKKYSFLWRLSIPILFIIYVISMVIVMPFKYIITGNYYWTVENKFIKFIENWNSKL